MYVNVYYIKFDDGIKSTHQQNRVPIHKCGCQTYIHTFIHTLCTHIEHTYANTVAYSRAYT